MVYKPQTVGMTREQRMQRLEDLRVIQGRDIDAIKDEFEIDFHIDEMKAIKLNGRVDKVIYNVWQSLFHSNYLFSPTI